MYGLVALAEGTASSLDGIATAAAAIWTQIGEVVTNVTTSGNEMFLLGIAFTVIGFAIGAFKSLTGQRRRRGK